ncbi:glycosyltransferase family 4 protein [Aequorivita xiaoshiensis]|uniref:Glycosyltransferase family 4 protein n=1 Tax=Aequorivita xiaoshiensis TaxID=2874476 RepID=A0A9X1U450_9FLAO|nr:glycosyltransferase family 4 protein [Aequorivita xiaoshiensis]MCG2430485.1 glycosyltransferase family 4 protein [Aequorivita xiaoshiensis]
MIKPLKIIIFDGSFKTRSFINRLAQGLTERHQVYILGFNETLPNRLEKVNYIPLGSNQSKIRFVKTTLQYALQAGSIKLVYNTLKKIALGRRKELHKQNLKFVLQKIGPDVIHLQWLSVIPWFEEVLSSQTTPVVLSQLGFHVNVRPFVNDKNFSYLQRWYSKMAGFHSVSKAISRNGDKIWNDTYKIDKVVYTGLPLEITPFLEKYYILNSLQLLSVGRPHWIKGYDYALQTCKRLKDQNISFHYTIIGGAGNEELQFLIADLGLKGYVSLAASASQSEVFDVMRSSSLLLMPSLEEGIPNVVVEAMAIGLPVISTDCGGISELITNGVNGWVVPTRNPEAMAVAVMNFRALSLKKIGAVRVAAREKVERQHNEERMVEGMEELYFQVRSTN